MSDPYKPLACSLYDVLEAASMRKQRLRLTIGGEHRDVMIRDVFSKGPEEFLIAADPSTGREETIRLDRIELITDLVEGKTYTANRC
ncbi:MAG: hypothetical protein HYW57_07915 [Ignavibacteriales bacterium]|nr:hypothetical protein [Ignavibacteriales bacterium]